MGEGKTNMFGKTYNTIGSTDSNFLIKTKGDLKVQWGGKYIDVIKNGKVASAGSDILKVASSSDDISSNGIYLVPTEQGNEVWVSIDGTKILLNTTGEQYISFLEEQKLTSEQKDMALTNIGFNYETLQEAKDANIKAGIIFIKDSGQLYVVKDGTITEYSNQSTGNVGSTLTKLTVGDIQLYENFIRGVTNLNIGVKDQDYIRLKDNIITITKNIITSGTSIESQGASTSSGYRLYMKEGKSVLEVDQVVVRDSIEFPEKYIDVSVEAFRTLIEQEQLEPNQQYRLYNFRNFWELVEPEVLEGDSTEEAPVNVRPLIVTAKNRGSYYSNTCFFEEDSQCIVSYDVSYNKQYTVNGEIIQALGLITKMTDSNKNECNYNFRHLKFLKDGNWVYTFQNQEQINEYSSNIIQLNNIRVEVSVQGSIVVLEDFENYAIFSTPCYNNTFSRQDAPLVINDNFNGNTILQTWNNVTYKSIVGCLFKRGASDVIINSVLEECTFEQPINNTNLFQDSNLVFKNCQFLQTVTGDIQPIDNTIKELLKSGEPKQITFSVEEGVKRLVVTSNSSLEIPAGAIIMWHGAEIPYGWAICDGTNGTPNLVGKFIKAVATSDSVGDNETQLNENNELTITQENLPKHSHPHQSHTHNLSGDLSGTTSSSGDLTVSLDYSDYNWGISSDTKTVITSVSGEGVTSESGTVESVTNIKTQGGAATGGNHTHSISLGAGGETSLSPTVSQEEPLLDSEWPNKPIKIEPRSYSLIFIMKL